MCISDWSSDVCSSDLAKSVVVGREDQLRSEAAAALKTARRRGGVSLKQFMSGYGSPVNDPAALWSENLLASISSRIFVLLMFVVLFAVLTLFIASLVIDVSIKSTGRSEEHTSELQSLMRISYAVFCLKKKKQHHTYASY